MTPAATEKRPLGRTGLRVTPICFGTTGLGDMPDTYGYSVEAERAKRTLYQVLKSRTHAPICASRLT